MLLNSMKTMIVVGLLMVLGTCLSSPIDSNTRGDLTREQIQKLAEYMFTLEAQKVEFQDKAENIKYQPNKVSVGKGESYIFVLLLTKTLGVQMSVRLLLMIAKSDP